MPLSPNDSDVYSALITDFFSMILPANTPVVRGQSNRIPMPNVPCVILTTIGAPRRIGTNTDTVTVEGWSADGAPIDTTADGYPNEWTADGAVGELIFTATSEADFEYSIQADFYSPDAESWAMATELLWRDKFGWYSMPDGMKPLYSEGRQQLPLIGGEEQWVQRWTMTLVLDYKPTFTQSTQAATVANVIPEPIDVFYPPSN